MVVFFGQQLQAGCGGAAEETLERLRTCRKRITTRADSGNTFLRHPPASPGNPHHHYYCFFLSFLQHHDVDSIIPWEIGKRRERGGGGTPNLRQKDASDGRFPWIDESLVTMSGCQLILRCVGLDRLELRDGQSGCKIWQSQTLTMTSLLMP